MRLSKKQRREYFFIPMGLFTKNCVIFIFKTVLSNTERRVKFMDEKKSMKTRLKACWPISPTLFEVLI